MPSNSSWVHLENCTIKAETENAILATGETPTGEEFECWIPRSQISEGDKYGRDDTDVTISVTEWLARKEEGLSDA